MGHPGSAESVELQRVHIEFQRVQTWLFAVPRLRAMVGANALLGKTLRSSLPNLAREQGRCWVLKPSTEEYPRACENDPLRSYDDPASDAVDGILSRDGGHFVGQFERGANAFATAAAELLRQEVPGLRFRISIDEVERMQSCRYVSTELPVLSPCKWTGHGLASTTIRQGDELHSVSLDVRLRYDAAKSAQDGTGADLATLLMQTTRLKGLERAQTLEELVDGGYLALIHADGNGVGSGVQGGELVRARFYHRNRVLLRRAMQTAIDSVYTDELKLAPLVPLMLGGDDLLVLCRAEIALPFVVNLCTKLDELQRCGNSHFELTVGVGVVIAKHTIPIHRLHEVAEQLASSAKRRFRGLAAANSKVRSVVDWAVYTTSWVDEPEEVRRRDWVRGAGQSQRLLSQRPLEVLGMDLDCLQGLLKGAEKVVDSRSQLRYLLDQLPRGKALSELAFAELSRDARRALTEAGVTAPWRAVDKGSWITELLDLMEISEIGRLGRNSEIRESHDPSSEREATYV